MKSTGIIRPIDELGRIVIPKEMRTNMNLVKDDPIEIYVEGDKIILTKINKTCVFCDSMTELTTFKDRPICKACFDEFKGIE